MEGFKGCNEFTDSLLLAINEASPDGILVVDHLNEIISVNSRFFTVWGITYDASDLGVTPVDSDTPILEQALSRVIDQEGFLLRVRQLYANTDLDDHSEIELKDGRILERYSTALHGVNNVYLGRVWYFRDISSQKRLENELRELTVTDHLTGLANRRYFFKRANEEFLRIKRRYHSFCVIMLDMDNFKKINDNWGHDAGDVVLKEAALAWSKELRAQDVLARIGGEEFAILLPDTHIKDALVTAKRLEAALAKQNRHSQLMEIRYTASIGVAESRADDCDFDNCVRRADSALYKAKAAGRNRIELQSE